MPCPRACAKTSPLRELALKAQRLSNLQNREKKVPIRITHGERVIDPSTGLTKRQLADYYTKVADWMLPLLPIDRYRSFVRPMASKVNSSFSATLPVWRSLISKRFSAHRENRQC